jgi:leucyl aminopeptidase
MKHTFNSKSAEKLATKSIGRIDVQNIKRSKTFVSDDGKTTIVLGVKPAKEMTRRRLVTLARRVIKKARVARFKKIVVDFDRFIFEKLDLEKEEVAELLATNFEMANYEFTQFRTKPEDGWREVQEVIISGRLSARVKEAFRRGKIIGEEVNRARTLANTPGGSMTPKILASRARDAVKKLPVKVKVLGEREMHKLKMGAVLGVGQGSSEESKFIIMEYRGAPKNKKFKPLVFVGKGVTFDTGGINLKRGDHALGMNMDMSGGAAVIATMTLIARLKVKRDVIGLIPAVENMPSGTSYRPGDCLRSMSGKTIEVLNTDAEGRVIMADAITYAKRYKPSHVIDVATLTGAAMGALGTYCSAIFTKDDTFADTVSDCGEESGDYVWRLPLWSEYESEIRGRVGDVTNANAKKIPYGGAINAAMFLYQFAKDLDAKWMHIDMAPRMVAADDEQLNPGAAGAPVRLMLKMVEKL